MKDFFEYPVVDKMYTLEKFPGKGGWVYARIPEVAPDKSNPFGWVLVSGKIEQYPLNNCKLMPMGDGSLFLPVNATMRKFIGKKEGDNVHIILYTDENGIVIPRELQECLELEGVFQQFRDLPESEQKRLRDWIYEVKTDHAQVERIAELIRTLFV